MPAWLSGLASTGAKARLDIQGNIDCKDVSLSPSLAGLLLLGSCDAK
jgi:hypothetical protein